MPVYTIDDIMAVKDKYREKPYPEFSLQNVIRRIAPSTLVRGDNAFVAKRATNQEDAVRKTVQSALNRLNEENFDEIVDDLQTDMMLEKGAIRIFVQLAFEKALQEPAYCHIYARLCYYIARYEVMHSSNTPSSPTDGSPRVPQSAVRNAIIERAQAEFNSKDEFVPPVGATPEAAAEALSRFMKRKKANIKFVGNLYLTKVLSVNVMLIIISQLIGTDASVFPSETNIEVLIEMLDIVGAKMEDQEPKCVEEVFDRLQGFLKRKPAYAPRIHFKIMDSVETRNNGWVSREMIRQGSEATPSSRKVTAAKPGSGPSPAGVRVGTPTAVGGRMQFPSGPAAGSSHATPTPPLQHVAPAAAAPTAAPVSKEAGAWKNVLLGKNAPAAGGAAASTTAAAPTAAGAAPAAGVSMASATSAIPGSTLKAAAKLVDEIRAKWGTDEAGSALKSSWHERFQHLELSRPDLTAAVIQHVATKACTTTRSYAQAEAAGFLSCGLGLTPAASLPGLTRTLINAIMEGIVEDAPKFNERLVHVLEDIHRAELSGKPHEEGEDLAPLDTKALTQISTNLAAILLYSLDGLKECDFFDDLVVEGLLPVWRHLPNSKGSVDEPAFTKGVLEVATQCGAANPQALHAAAELMWHAKTEGWINGSASGAYMASNGANPALVSALQAKGFVKK
jgi:hypothetical protein